MTFELIIVFRRTNNIYKITNVVYLLLVLFVLLLFVLRFSPNAFGLTEVIVGARVY